MLACPIAWRGTGPRPTLKGDGLANRSAGACPPRSPDPREKRTPAKAVSLSIEAWRGTGPRPTVSGTFFHGETARFLLIKPTHHATEIFADFFDLMRLFLPA